MISQLAYIFFPRLYGLRLLSYCYRLLLDYTFNLRVGVISLLRFQSILLI